MFKRPPVCELFLFFSVHDTRLGDNNYDRNRNTDEHQQVDDLLLVCDTFVAGLRSRLG